MLEAGRGLGESPRGSGHRGIHGEPGRQHHYPGKGEQVGSFEVVDVWRSGLPLIQLLAAA